MDFKLEPNYDSGNSNENSSNPTWFDVPIKRSISPNDAQQDNSDIDTFENDIDYSPNIKQESVRLDYSEAEVTEGRCPLQNEVFSAVCSNSCQNKVNLPKNSELSQICCPVRSKVEDPYFEVEFNNIDIKKDSFYDKNSSNSNFVHYSDDLNHQKLEAVIRLTKISVYARNFVCRCCYLVFSSYNNMKLHELIHKEHKMNRDDFDKIHELNLPGEKPLKYKICDCRRPQSSSATLPKVTRKAKKVFKCSECLFICKRSGDLNRHRLTHDMEKKYRCDQCSFTCKLPAYLKTHKMVHTGKKPFKCDLCDYSCIQSGNLKLHKVKHSSEKTFQCPECLFTCKRPGDLKRHRSTHSDEKIFKCELCDYKCVSISYLRRHRVIHSEAKTFMCEECDFTCKRQNDLKRHHISHLKQNIKSVLISAGPSTT